MSSTSSLSSDDRLTADFVEENTKPKAVKKAAAKSTTKKTAVKAENGTNATTSKKRGKAAVKKEESDDEDVAPPAKKSRGKAKAKVEKAEDGEDATSAPAKPKGKGKANVWPPADLDPSLHPSRAGHPIFPLPPLTTAPNGGIASTSTFPRPLYIGAHTSIAGGVATALFRAGKAGANGVAMFVKSQRQWKSNPFEQDTIDKFHEAMKPKEKGGMGYGPETILVHGSYLINLGNPDPVKWNTSYQCFKDDIQRCYQLGIKLYNWQ
jgi:AP endonuclease-1